MHREDALHESKIREELATGDFNHLRYIGMGGKIWEVGGFEEVAVQVPIEMEEGQDSEPQYREETVSRRTIKRVGLDGVRDVEIWKYDTLDVL